MHTETEGSEQEASALVRPVYVCSVSFLHGVIEEGDGTTQV